MAGGLQHGKRVSKQPAAGVCSLRRGGLQAPIMPPASPDMSLKSCITRTCIAGRARNPAADMQHRGTTVYAQWRSYRHSTVGSTEGLVW